MLASCPTCLPKKHNEIHLLSHASCLKGADQHLLGVGGLGRVVEGSQESLPANHFLMEPCYKRVQELVESREWRNASLPYFCTIPSCAPLPLLNIQ